MQENKKKYLKGKFLISASTLSDPVFAKTVVFLLEHDQEGAFGLVMNRPSSANLFEVLDDMPEAAKKINVFSGGPVQPQILFVLHQNLELVEEPELQTINQKLYWGSSNSLLFSLLNNSLPLQVFHGYAGWGRGQLEAELQQNSWFVAAADKHNFLEQPSPPQDSDVMWRDFLTREGGIYAYFAQNVQDPALN